MMDLRPGGQTAALDRIWDFQRSMEYRGDLQAILKRPPLRQMLYVYSNKECEGWKYFYVGGMCRGGG